MKHTLLIADGDGDLRDLYRTFFTDDRGYEVEISTDGLDCVRKLRLLKPVALVLDQDLCWGGCDGVLAWMREKRSTLGIPTILTGSDHSSQLSPESIELPVVACLPKPFALVALFEAVCSALATTGRGEQDSENRLSAFSELFIG